MSEGERPLLEVRDLVTVFDLESGAVPAVDSVSFDVRRGETVALVGESGSGKSVTAFSILRILTPPGRIASGQIFFEGRDLVALPEPEMRRLRGSSIAMIFQEPMTSLNPVFTVGDQVGEPLRIHRGYSRKRARAEAIRLLSEVSIPDAARRVDDYPHQMSGGMRQRVMIAMALACDPVLLVADEPTTALDVTIQAQVLELLERLRASRGLAVLLITHDLGVVAETSERAVVFYAGRVVETGSVERIFRAPAHPYTKGLLASIPARARRGEPLPAIPGMIPPLGKLPPGCVFEPRCPEAIERCRSARPPLHDLGKGLGDSRCVLAEPPGGEAK
jgi:oligopeptide/dipeptide ABC transporter ATP-binding protein